MIRMYIFKLFNRLKGKVTDGDKYKITIQILLLQIVLGCSANSELETAYKEQLIAYNNDIEKIEKRVCKTEDERMEFLTRGVLPLKSVEEVYQNDRKKLEELLQKRQELKLRTIENLGKLPKWWWEAEKIILEEHYSSNEGRARIKKQLDQAKETFPFLKDR